MLPRGIVVNPPSHRPAKALAGSCRVAALLAALLIGTTGQADLAAESGSMEQPASNTAKTQSTLKVFDTDDRQVVGDTTQLPWSTIGMLRSTWWLSNGQQLVSSGTATLVSDNMVLTSGHCIYDQTEGWADEVVFVPGANAGQEPFGQAHSIRLIAQRGWVEGDDHHYDLAMVVLDKPIGQQTGYFSIAVKPDSFFVNRLLNTAGYPADDMPGNVQYFTSGTSSGVEDGLILDKLDSEPGQSGSPIWHFEADPIRRDLVGVLTGSRQSTTNGQTVTDYNVAVKINESFAQWINENITKYGTVTVLDPSTRSDVSPATPTCGAGLAGAGLLAIGLMYLRGVTTNRVPRQQSSKASGQRKYH